MDVQRTDMQPLMHSRIDLQPQALEPSFLGFIIFQRDVERNVMECGLLEVELVSRIEESQIL